MGAVRLNTVQTTGEFVKRRYFAGALMVGGASVVITLFSCAKKSVNNQDVVYSMQDYFPLSEGNSWTYQINALQNFWSEPTVDGDISLGEPFNDVNQDGVFEPYEPFIDAIGPNGEKLNGTWDPWEYYEDLNGNGQWDSVLDYWIACGCPENQDLNHDGRYESPCDGWTQYIPYLDLNGDGDFDPANAAPNYGEPYVDLNGDGYWGMIINVPKDSLLTVKFTLTRPDSLNLPTNVFLRSPHLSRPFDFPRLCSGWFWGVVVMQDRFSNDGNGLRWWGDEYYLGRNDIVAAAEPIIIAEPFMKIRQEVRNQRTIRYQLLSGEDTISVEWISRLDGAENVTIPAGRFLNCLKFVTIASGWPDYMSHFNGTSTQWYAKGVGLVKSSGPRTQDSWVLQSAIVNGMSYPR